MIRLRALLTSVLCCVICCLLAADAIAQRKKSKKKEDEEPKPQVLEVLPELPEAIAGDSARLVFQVSPLSTKGLLSQQIRDALKALDQQRRGATIIKLRAFVAGSGDLRRVRDIVAEEFTERHQPLPVVTTVQVGALPLIGAQVVIESIALDRRNVNPVGVALLSGVPAGDTAAALQAFANTVSQVGLKPANILRVTCFLNTLEPSPRNEIVTAYPGAVVNLLQKQRQVLEMQTTCEGAGRLETPPSTAVVVHRGAALLNSSKLVFTSAQLIFRDQPADFRLGFQRLARTLQPLGMMHKDVVWSGAYALTRANAAQLESLQWEFLDKGKPPAGTALLFEGLPSSDATAAVELIAATN